MIIPRGHGDEIRHGHYFVVVGDSAGQGAEITLIVGVHRHYDIELVEIAHAHLTAMMVKIIAPPYGMHAHALVGQLADVPTPRAGRVDMPAVALATGGNYRFQHPLGSRRAAYITEAHE